MDLHCSSLSFYSYPFHLFWSLVFQEHTQSLVSFRPPVRFAPSDGRTPPCLVRPMSRRSAVVEPLIESTLSSSWLAILPTEIRHCWGYWIGDLRIAPTLWLLFWQNQSSIAKSPRPQWYEFGELLRFASAPTTDPQRIACSIRIRAGYQLIV